MATLVHHDGPVLTGIHDATIIWHMLRDGGSH